MHEDLLGYLLGALEPHEMRRVAQRLQDDPEARRQLEQIERSLRPLEEGFEPPSDPPPDLVSRTLANLPPLPAPGGDAAAGDAAAGDVGNSASSMNAAFSTESVSAPDAATPLTPMMTGSRRPVLLE